jgi:hypothetical protein
LINRFEQKYQNLEEISLEKEDIEEYFETPTNFAIFNILIKIAEIRKKERLKKAKQRST